MAKKQAARRYSRNKLYESRENGPAALDEGRAAQVNSVRTPVLIADAKTNPSRALELVAWACEEEIARIARKRKKDGALVQDELRSLVLLGEFFAKHHQAMREAIEEQMGDGVRQLPDEELRDRFIETAKQLGKIPKDALRGLQREKDRTAYVERKRELGEEADVVVPASPPEAELGEALEGLPPPPPSLPSQPVRAERGGSFDQCEELNRKGARCQRRRGHWGQHVRGMAVWSTDAPPLPTEESSTSTS